MSYQPMARPVCTTTPDQMNEKLQRRVRDAKEKSDGQQPQSRSDGRDLPSAARLVWRPKEPGAVYIITECGRYTVDAARMPGSEYRYSAWARATTSGELPTPLGCCDTGAEAKALCEEHLRAPKVNP